MLGVNPLGTAPGAFPNSLIERLQEGSKQTTLLAGAFIIPGDKLDQEVR
jgi:hypothetical protein